MPTEVIMPKVDMDMASGRISVWHIAEGERVEKGDPLFDIETDKAAMEVESPGSGVLHYPAPEGTEVPIGTPCAWLYGEGEEVGKQPAAFATLNGAGAEAAPVDSAPSVTEDTPPPAEHTEPATGGKTRATPKARALAGKAGLDIASIAGNGPNGRVQAEDVRDALRAFEQPAGAAPSTVTFDTGPLAVTRSNGGTGTPLVMIHGFASDTMSWAGVEAHLKGRTIIRIDLPGHGKSPKLKIGGFPDFLKILRQTFDALDLDRAHLVGHSLGAALCLGLADTRPKGVSALTLLAPAGLGPEVNGPALTGICNATRVESLAPWLRMLVGNEDLITDSYARIVMSGRSDPDLRAVQAAMADALFPDGVQAFDLRPALDRLTVPTRIIWGKGDAIIPWKHALRADGRTALHLFGGVGHMPQIECSEDVAKIISASE